MAWRRLPAAPSDGVKYSLPRGAADERTDALSTVWTADSWKRVTLEAQFKFPVTNPMQRQRETMDENPMNNGPRTQDAKEAANRGGLSRRSILNIMKGIGASLGSAVILGKETIVAFAQQITGVLGSPSATTTIPGNQLPPPPPEFGGVINETVKDSKPWWPPRVVPPQGAPNVLLIMTDDQGYGVSSTFGGVIPTPALDRVAAAGLRYTQFHSTALCSATRATTPTSVRKTPRSAGSCAATATRLRGSARTTTRRRLNTQALTTSGRREWALTISTASWAASPTKGRPICSAITPRFFPGSTSPATT